MHVGIFETEHFEAAYPVIRLFDNGENDITIFVYEQSYRQLQFLLGKDIARYRWIIKKKNESKYHFIYKMYKECRKQGIRLLYLNTVTDNHLFYALLIRLLPRVRCVLTLHDINTYFNFTFSFSFKRWIRFTGKRYLIRIVKEFNVISATMVDYLKSKLGTDKVVFNVPGSVYEGLASENIPPADAGKINIVVPGTIDGRRRNYEMVFDLLEKCNAASVPVSVVLLGMPFEEYGRMILEKCRLYAIAHHNLLCYETDVVDQPEFDRVMKNAHLVFSPTVIDTILFDGIVETYGISISSGNVFDVVKNAKPFIIPKALKVPPDIESSCFRYNTVPDIVNFLQHCLNEPSFYHSLVQKAHNNSANYTVAEIRGRNSSLLRT